METDMSHTADYDTLLKIVRTWPAPKRVHFVQTILATLAPQTADPSQHQPTLPRARGLLTTPGQVAPSDADIARLLDERRQERYGL